MNNELLIEKLLTAISNINKYKQISCVSKEEFSCNDMSIKLALGVFEEIIHITNLLDPHFILSNEYLTKELPLINMYNKNLFNIDGSVNAYKLYDFLNYEVKTIYNKLSSSNTI